MAGFHLESRLSMGTLKPLGGSDFQKEFNMDIENLYRRNRRFAEEVKTLIHKYVDKFVKIHGRDFKLKFMNFCGTHEWTTVHYGIRSLLPENIELVAGPGCLDPNTPVLLEGNRTLSIGELENQWLEERVVTYGFDGKAQLTELIRYMKLNPKDFGLKVYEVVTKETSRRIVATGDHPFYVKGKGKVQLYRLKVSDKVAVYPSKPLKCKEESIKDRIVLNCEDIVKSAPEGFKVEDVIKELKDKNLLPLSTGDKNLLILARLLGHIFGDGYLTYSLKKTKYSVEVGFTGEIEDLNVIKEDLKRLGFPVSAKALRTRWSQSTVFKNGKNHVIKGRANSIVCYSKTLWVLLKALGAPVGDKTRIPFRVPEWIKSAPLSVQREFISAYFGSELRKPSANKLRGGKQFQEPSFTVCKLLDLVDNGLRFCEDVRDILEKFNVKLRRISVKYRSVRKTGEKTAEIIAYISNSSDSLLNLYGTIGYTYSVKKDGLARQAFEYLTIKEALKRKRMDMAVRALELRKRGFTKCDIIADLRCDCVRLHDIKTWLDKGVNISNIRAPLDFPPFEEWKKTATDGFGESGFVWEEIESIKEVEVDDVRDLTTFEETHNFIANGFLVGNCPVCITPSFLVEHAIKLSFEDVRVYTFGDAFKLPAVKPIKGVRSLSEAKTSGGNVTVVYSFLDALRGAYDYTKDSVFLAIGFETTAPGYAIPLINHLIPRNMYILSALRLTPPAAEYSIMEAERKSMPSVDGIIAPGHVSAITGAKPWDEVSKKLKIPSVIAGFEPLDLLLSILELLRMIWRNEVGARVEYRRVVSWNGNVEALKAIGKAFTIVDSPWRGIGFIDKSGLEIRDVYSHYDAFEVFGLEKPTKASWNNDSFAGCRCAEVILGLAKPIECGFFLNVCNPSKPLGPCMVSSEGTCSIWARFGGYLNLKKLGG